MRWFGHSGDLGDVIYALPAMRAAGGGVLYLYHQDGKTAHGMDAGRAASLRSLLSLQPYIDDVIFCPEGHPPGAEDHDLNGFRDHGMPGRNLADMHLATMGLGHEQRDAQWLIVDREVSAHAVIFARSPRYQNKKFLWGHVWDLYRHKAGFVGSREEHQDFCRFIGDVPWVPTQHLLDVARAIAGSDFLSGTNRALRRLPKD